MSAFVIVAPQSSGKSLSWRALEPTLAHVYPYMSVAFPRRRGEAAAMVSAALREGHSEIVAVGGGGTINEAINGFFDSDGALSPDAVLAVVPARDGVVRLKQAPIRPIDIGRVQYLSRDGLPRTRYFATMASLGLSGEIVDRMNHSWTRRLLGRKAGFWLAQSMGALFYHGRAIRLIVDQTLDEILSISTVAVANGTVFGGPVDLAPEALPDDGQFDVVVMPAGDDPVRILRGKKVVAAPVEDTRGKAVLVELDGGNTGRLPATFEILPRALNVRC